jgi:hypothetical protein
LLSSFFPPRFAIVSFFPVRSYRQAVRRTGCQRFAFLSSFPSAELLN